MNKTEEINKLIDKSLRISSVSLDTELNLLMDYELKQKRVTLSRIQKRKSKEIMEKTFQELKIDIAKIDSGETIDEKVLKTGGCA